MDRVDIVENVCASAGGKLLTNRLCQVGAVERVEMKVRDPCRKQRPTQCCCYFDRYLIAFERVIV